MARLLYSFPQKKRLRARPRLVDSFLTNRGPWVTCICNCPHAFYARAVTDISICAGIDTGTCAGICDGTRTRADNGIDTTISIKTDYDKVTGIISGIAAGTGTGTGTGLVMVMVMVMVVEWQW